MIQQQVIRAAAKANLSEYDPWAPYAESEGKQRNLDVPYRDLLELAQNLVFHPRPNTGDYGPTGETEHLILDWCRRYGLLGILPAVSRKNALVHVFTTTFPCHTSVVPPQGLAPVRAADRSAGPNVFITHNFDDALVPKGWPAPDTRTWDWTWAGSDVTPWSAYFSQDIERTGNFPMPGTKTFWESYGEPVHDFCQWIKRFRDAVEVLNEFDHAKGETEEKKSQANRALGFMECLANTITTAGSLEPRVHRTTFSPSLLSSFAEMFLRDLEKGRRVLRCQTCGRLLVSGDTRAQYCSQKCRNTMQRRRHRERHAEGGN